MKSSLGWYVGYTYEISEAGIVRQARAVGEETAAVFGYNHNSVSICLDGNFDVELPTVEQIGALRGLLRGLVKEYGIDPNNILHHRAKATTHCFGTNLPDDWARNIYADGLTKDEPQDTDRAKAVLEDYQNKLIFNAETGRFGFADNGVLKVISDERAALAALTVLIRNGYGIGVSAELWDEMRQGKF